MADAAADENSGPRRSAGLECLYDVVASVRGALRKLRTHACDRAAELDLQRNPRQHLDERGISGLLGDILVKLPIAHRKCFRISALQRDHDPDEDILKSPDVVVAHLRDGEFDRETFKQFEQLVEIRGLAAGKTTHVKAAIGLDLDQPSLCQYPDRLAERGSTHPQPVDHPFLVHPSAARQFAGEDQANDFFIDPLAQSSLSQFFNILDQHKGCACRPARLGLTDRDVPAEHEAIALAYLTSGAGDSSENARSNDARSSGGMSETAM